MVKDNEHSARESSIASGWTVEGRADTSRDGGAPAAAEPRKGASAVEEADAHSSEGPRSESLESESARELPSGVLVFLGLIGGVYLLFTYVWFSWASAAAAANAVVIESSGSVGGVLQQAIFWIAPFALPLWFVSVLVLGRELKVRFRVLYLLLGLVVLVPLPMFGGMF